MDKFFASLFQKKIVFLAVLVLLLTVVASVIAPIITRYGPLDINPVFRLQAPNSQHFFGTDNFGRDIFSRIVYGARATLFAGVGVVLFSLLGGVLFGVLSAYFSRLGLVLMRIVDIILGFPSLLLALALIAILDRSFLNTIFAVGATYMATTARIVYGLSLKIIAEVYIEAAKSIGASNTRVILSHILPNLVSPLIVQMTFIFAFSQLQIASLDFLGLGLPPEIPSWGNMLSEAKIYIVRAPWLLWFPGGMIVLTVLALNLFGDFLRDKLDPKFKNEL
jgi:peptide/nickel transport system permease protein